jgi:hypothetical protein
VATAQASAADFAARQDGAAGTAMKPAMEAITAGENYVVETSCEKG